MAKPNYAYAKRQRDLAKKQKTEVKRQRKAEAGQAIPPPGAENPITGEGGESSTIESAGAVVPQGHPDPP